MSEQQGRGIFAKDFIKQGEYIMVEKPIHSYKKNTTNS